MLLAILVFMCCGAVTGMLAGLLGIGGGTVIVPQLDVIFIKLGYNPDLVHQMALGTSLASILVTSISSTRAHAKRGAVRWDLFARLAPGILVGTFLAGLVATKLPAAYLKVLFVVFLFFVSSQMLSGYRPPASREMPGRLGTMGAGGVIGVLSAFVGIGGGSLTVPYLSFCNVPVHNAVGTSAAVGFPLALAGTIGYLAGGWGVEGLPEGCLGFICLPAFFGIATVSFFVAPLGARISHSLPTEKLKKGFACFLMLTALHMASTLF